VVDLASFDEQKIDEILDNDKQIVYLSRLDIAVIRSNLLMANVDQKRIDEVTKLIQCWEEGLKSFFSYAIH